MKEKKLKLLTKILAIVIICLVSFFGVYVQKGNTMQNVVKEFQYSKDLKGYREFVFELSDAFEVLDSDGKLVGNTDTYSDSDIESNSYTKTENKVNPDENVNYDNYKKAKKIIEERLKGLGIQDYNISLDGESGKIYLQIPENSETDHVASNLLQMGKFVIKDSEDNSKVFVSNSNIKKVSTVYNNVDTETGVATVVSLQFEFDKTAKETLKEISNGEYKTNNSTENNTSEDSETEDAKGEEEETTEENNEEAEKNEEEENDEENKEEDNQKKIILAIDDNDLITDSFNDPIENGMIVLSMNQATNDKEALNKTVKSTSTIATVLNSGEMPLKYKISQNNFIGTNIKTKHLTKIVYGIVIIVLLLIISLIIKNKKRGIIASISFIGFIALNILLIKYTNVLISIESIIAEIIVICLNYNIIRRLISIDEKDEELKNKLFLEEFKQTIAKLMPIFISSIVFAFIKWETIATFGMILFWGILLGIGYNFIVTKKLIEN